MVTSLIIVVCLRAVFSLADKELKQFNTKPLIKEDGYWTVNSEHEIIAWNFRKPFEQPTTAATNDGDCIAYSTVQSWVHYGCVGDLNTETFGLLPNDEGFTLAYTSVKSGRGTSFRVKCSKGDMKTSASENGVNFDVIIESPAGCIKKDGLGWGWLFIIILFSSLLLLFAIGIPINKFARKKTGVEVIPFFFLWVGIPRMVMEGVKCLFSPCRNKKRGFDPLE
ncbi:hypothetical protein BLNAU_4673 [Blattamonas nauphoetae]|uniref:Uncharacterized protein n=1 Tax=Blattamonas nauphoetae TaxID=2049346 RepID=A0ABQ9Y9T7_9EUKA|nr:hypothetical protein BLNAU_4673 [Blattamonas nauphoetae]